MNSWRRWVLGACWLLSACFSVTEPPVLQGGETHFLRACGSGCSAGFSCSCGVCTRTCDSADSCKSLGANATCLSADGIGDTRGCSAGERAGGDVCDERCVDPADCRAGFSCQAGLCRTAPAAVSSTAGAGSTPADAGMSMPAAKPAGPLPLVMLLSDTSGSMERLNGCLCTTLGCSECLPDCADGQPSRWHGLLGALTGSFAPYGCTAQLRTADNGATYDVGYSIPHFELSANVKQRADGILDRFAGRVTFASATFDGAATTAGAPDQIPLNDFSMLGAGFRSSAGEYSYAVGDGSSPRLRPDGSSVGEIYYPTCQVPYIMDTGIQSADATGGALFTAVPRDPASVTSLKANLRAVRPFGGTPIAAALDDLYYYFAEDPNGAPARQASAGRYVILITDGYPDDDFRVYPSPGCACATTEACGGEDPALMHCPYPTAADGAQHLRCGFDGSGCQGPVDKLFVVGYSIGTDAQTLGQLNAIAAAGGSDSARNAQGPVELRAALNAILEEIAAP